MCVDSKLAGERVGVGRKDETRAIQGTSASNRLGKNDIIFGSHFHQAI